MLLGLLQQMFVWRSKHTSKVPQVFATWILFEPHVHLQTTISCLMPMIVNNENTVYSSPAESSQHWFI